VAAYAVLVGSLLMASLVAPGRPEAVRGTQASLPQQPTNSRVLTRKPSARTRRPRAGRYSDYVRTPSGLQYQDLRPGAGPSPAPGASVTVDWDGYTIGRAGPRLTAHSGTVDAHSACSHACV